MLKKLLEALSEMLDVIAPRPEPKPIPIRVRPNRRR